MDIKLGLKIISGQDFRLPLQIKIEFQIQDFNTFGAKTIIIFSYVYTIIIIKIPVFKKLLSEKRYALYQGHNCIKRMCFQKNLP